MKLLNKWFNPVMLFVILFPFVQYFGTGVQQVVGADTDNTQTTATTGHDITKLDGWAEDPDKKDHTAIDEDGKSVTTLFTGTQITPSGRINIGDPVSLDYTWSIPDTVHAKMTDADFKSGGYYFNFKLPVSLDISQDMPGETISSPIIDKASQSSIGTVTFNKNGNAQMRITKNPSGSNINGTVSISGVATHKGNNATLTSSIPFSANSDNKLPPITVSGKDDITKTVNKTVTYNDANKMATIKWAVTINNSGETLNPTPGTDPSWVTDHMPDDIKKFDYTYTIDAEKPVIDSTNGTFNGSFTSDSKSDGVMYQADADKDGTHVHHFTSGDSDPKFVFSKPTNDRFTINYTTQVPYSALSVTQKDDKAGTIDANDTKKITNTATLHMSNNRDDQPVSTDISVGYQAHLQKKSEAPDKNGLIKWTVTLTDDHYNQPNIAPLPISAVIKDTLSDGQKFATQNGSEPAVTKGNSDEVAINTTGDSSFTITPTKTLSGPIEVTYYTKPAGTADYTKPVSDADAKDFVKNNTNKIDWIDKSITVPPTTPKVTTTTTTDNGNGTPRRDQTPKVPTVNIAKTYNKSQFTTDKNGLQQLVDNWVVTVNPVVYGLVLTDTMGSSLNFSEASNFTVVDNNGKPLTKGTDYVLNANQNGLNGFTLSLTDDWLNAHYSDGIKITYDTIRNNTLNTDSKDDQLAPTSNIASFTTPDGQKNHANSSTTNYFGASKHLNWDPNTPGVVDITDSFNAEHVTMPSDGVMVVPVPKGLHFSDKDGNVTNSPDKMGITVTTDGQSKNNYHYQFVDTVPDNDLDKLNAKQTDKKFTASDFPNGAIIVTGFDGNSNEQFDINYHGKLDANYASNNIDAHSYYSDDTYGYKDIYDDIDLYKDSDIIDKSGYLVDNNGKQILDKNGKPLSDMTGQQIKANQHALFTVTVHPSTNASNSAVVLDNTAVHDAFTSNIAFDAKEQTLDPNKPVTSPDPATKDFADKFIVAYKGDEENPFTEVDKPAMLPDASTIDTKAEPTYNVERNPRGFDLQFYGAITKPVVIEYTANITYDKRGTFSPTNDVTATGTGDTFTKDLTFNNLKTPIVAASETNDVGTIQISKTDSDKKGLQGATFKLVKVSDGSLAAELTTDKDGNATMNGIPTGDYKLVEKTAPTGYLLDPSSVAVTISKDTTTVVPPIVDKKIDTINLQGHKSWLGDSHHINSRPDKITVHLLQNGSKTNISTTTTADKNWNYEFKGLPKTDETGKPINYSAYDTYDSKYDKANGGNGPAYSAMPSDSNKPNDIDLTNVYNSTSISGVKIWDDNNDQDFMRPQSVKIDLIANGKDVVATQTADSAHNWWYQFNDLKTKDDAGKAIVYSVREEKVPNGYTSDVQGFNVVNTNVPNNEISIPVKKVWDDENNRDQTRPNSISVSLFANGNRLTQHKLSAADDWRYTFIHLPQKLNGHNVKYTVAEDRVPNGYTSTVDGVTITNHHTPNIQVAGKKIWDDHNNQDSIRPNSILVDLIANGNTIADRQTVTSANGWHYSFDNLPVYDGQHQKIDYTVAEDHTPTGYFSSVNGYNITNKHWLDSKVNITGQKTWDDKDNWDHIRPSRIFVNLLMNGKAVATTIATAKDNWKYKFVGIPQKVNGHTVKYTVAEKNVPAGYTSSVNGYNITNKHVLFPIKPKTTHLLVHKIWNDGNNADGIRPKQITIDLYSNGLLVQQKQISATNDWHYAFEHLPQTTTYTINGKPFTYTFKYSVAEDHVPAGYMSTVGAEDNDAVTITNTHTPTTPNTPNNPPKTPNTPTTPKTPKHPKKPHTPTKPKRPHLPNLPNTYGHNPHKPGYPTSPNQPNLPNTYGNNPSQPGLPNTYGTSSRRGLANTYGKNQSALPQTGERRIAALTVLGLMFLSMTCATFIYMKRRA